MSKAAIANCTPKDMKDPLEALAGLPATYQLPSAPATPIARAILYKKSHCKVGL